MKPEPHPYLATILPIILALVPLAQADRPLTLLSQGQPKALIVLPSKPSRAAVEGAKILADHLLQISGARLKVLNESVLVDAEIVDGRIKVPSRQTTADIFILVGEGELTKKLGQNSKGLGPGGILIRTVGNALVLLGPDGHKPADSYGTRYAVTTFLEDQLGCRYLWPGETGKVVPKRSTITINPINVRFTPLLTQRRIRWSGHSSRLQEGLDRLGFTREDFLRARETAASTRSESSDWMGWHRMGGTLALRTGDGTILPSKTWLKFLTEHPEWFAMQLDGSRYFDPNWPRPRLCKSNPDLIEAIAQEKIKELKRNPGQKSVSLMTNDGGGKAGFCMCPACKALDPPQGRPTRVWTYDHKKERTYRFDYVSLTDRMVYFYNAIAHKVAKVYPDVLFTGQAYSIYRAPPVKHRLHPNIVIRFVHSTAHYANDELRRQGMTDWDAWAEAASRIYWRPNLLLWGRRQGTLGHFCHKLAEDFHHIAHNKCVGTDFDSCVHNWATQGLNYYVLAKLHWNPDLDADKVIDDYCRSGFGDAAEPVKRFFLRIEHLTDQIAAKKPDTPDLRDADVTEPYTPQVIAELRRLLDSANKAAGNNKAVQCRIAFLRLGLDFTEVQAKVYRMLRLTAQRRLTATERQQATKLLDQRWLTMRKLFKENHYAINMAMLCWADRGRFRRLGWTGPSPKLKSTHRSK